MSEIKVNGNIEEALKKFKRQCARNGKNQRQLEKESFRIISSKDYLIDLLLFLLKRGVIY